MPKPRYITYNGERHNIREWSGITGLPEHTIHTRLRSGWSVERSLTEPSKYAGRRPSLHKQRYTATYKGETLSLTPIEWEGTTGVPSPLIMARIRKGWSAQDAVTTPTGGRIGHIVEYDGQRHNITEWSRITGIPPYLISMRLRSGWTAERALSTPSRHIKMPEERKGVKMYEYHGESHSMFRWEKKFGMKRGTIQGRISHGWSFEKAIKTKVRERRPAPSAEERARRRKESDERRFRVTYNGETKTLTEWAEISGIPYSVLYGRHKMKWEPGEMFIPVGARRENHLEAVI